MPDRGRTFGQRGHALFTLDASPGIPKIAHILRRRGVDRPKSQQPLGFGAGRHVGHQLRVLGGTPVIGGVAPHRDAFGRPGGMPKREVDAGHIPGARFIRPTLCQIPTRVAERGVVHLVELHERLSGAAPPAREHQVNLHHRRPHITGQKSAIPGPALPTCPHAVDLDLQPIVQGVDLGTERHHAVDNPFRFGVGEQPRIVLAGRGDRTCRCVCRGVCRRVSRRMGTHVCHELLRRTHTLRLLEWVNNRHFFKQRGWGVHATVHLLPREIRLGVYRSNGEHAAGSPKRLEIPP